VWEDDFIDVIEDDGSTDDHLDDFTNNENSNPNRLAGDAMMTSNESDKYISSGGSITTKVSNQSLTG